MRAAVPATAADSVGAASGVVRQRLRQDENAAVLANLTAHRGWTRTTAPMRRPFVCACTRLGCGAETSLDIDDYRARTEPLVLRAG